MKTNKQTGSKTLCERGVSPLLPVFALGEKCKMKQTIIAAIILTTAAIAGGTNCPEIATACATNTGLASWYSRESCKREGTGGKEIMMSNGKPLNDAAMTCAIWRTLPDGRVKRPDSRRLRVTNATTGRTITVKWTDNGPGKKQREEGVIIDLTPAAMRALAGEDGIKQGRVNVIVEETK
jgi:rare lipoprotein A (peptidoglycan hydrolase)